MKAAGRKSMLLRLLQSETPSEHGAEKLWRGRDCSKAAWDAVVLGDLQVSDDRTLKFVPDILRRFRAGSYVVLDALAMPHIVNLEDYRAQALLHGGDSFPVGSSRPTISRDG